jgi:hypothetical protein
LIFSIIQRLSQAAIDSFDSAKYIKEMALEKVRKIKANKHIIYIKKDLNEEVV